MHHDTYTCSSCCYFHPASHEYDTEYGNCHRHAPNGYAQVSTVLIDLARHAGLITLAQAERSDCLVRTWPTVRADQGCGEFCAVPDADDQPIKPVLETLILAARRAVDPTEAETLSLAAEILQRARLNPNKTTAPASAEE